MKKAKVSKGLVHHVWPWVKTLPDGTQVTKTLPPQYQGLNGKPVPDCIVDVPDEVQQNWVWDGEKYAPRVKTPIPPRRDFLIETVAEKLGISYDDLIREAKQKKLDAAAKKIETVTLLGLGASVYDWVTITHREFDELEGDVWTINSGARLFRHDVLWDMHTPEYLEKVNCERANRRRDWLKAHDKPIVMPKALPDFPTSHTFPLREVIARTNSCYFASGLAYPMAMAYCCDVERLRLFGCDFSYKRDTNTHPDEQGRACCEYWVGRLIEKGCRVEVTNNTHFLDMITRSKGRIYGYHEPCEFEFPKEGGKGRFIGPDYSQD